MFSFSGRSTVVGIKKILSDADMFKYEGNNEIGRLHFTHKDCRNDANSKETTLVYLSSLCYGRALFI